MKPLVTGRIRLTASDRGIPLTAGAWGTFGAQDSRSPGLPWSYTVAAMSSEPAESVHQGDQRELPVDVLLRRAKPLPPHDEMVIDDLTDEEGAAFLAALEE